MKRHKPFQSTCRKLWIHTSRTSIGFSSCNFRNTTEDGFNCCSSNNIDESIEQREQRETDCDMIFLHPTLSPTEKCGHDDNQMQQGGNTLLPTIEIEQQEDGEHMDDAIGQVHMQGAGSSELDKGSKTDTEDQQNNKQDDLDNIEVIYVEVGSFGHKKVAKETEGEDYDSLTQTSEESVALTAQAGEYDEIVTKTEKLRNDDIEIYDEIVNPSSARKGLGRRVKETAEQQQTSQSYKPQKPQDFESIEEMYVSVASHVREGSAETTDSESIDCEDKTIQLPQECAAVTPQGSEYDYIESSHRRIKKPKNIKDVEEVYDVVVNQLATRKNSETSSSIQPYSVPAPYEVAMSSNKAYALTESVPVIKNEAYGASEGGKIKGHTYDTFK